MQEERSTIDGGRIKVYVDSNILQGAISGRSTEDVVFLNSATEQNLEVFTSIYTLMELLDVAKDRQFLIKCIVEEWTDVATWQKRRKSKNLSKDDLADLTKILNNFFLTHRQIKFINIKETDWNLVKKIGESSNLHSSDILHLVTAWVGNCRVLVTNDDEFIREGNKILQQEKVYDRLHVCSVSTVHASINDKKISRKIDLRVKVKDQ